MIKRGDKFIHKGVILEITKALVDDHYIYATFVGVGFKKIAIRYFLKHFVSLTSLVNINYFKSRALTLQYI